jgi:hypothetical protein
MMPAREAIRHPKQAELALYAGGDASLWARLRVSRHVRTCATCAGLVREFRGLREWTRGQDELPEEVDWVQLAAEMKANIRVGLAAGQCVEPSPEAAGLRLWRPALVLPVLLVVVAGWWLQSWPPPHVPATEHAASEGLVVRANPGSIEVEQDGRALALLHPRSAQVTLSASGGSLRARYVDAETGYVTISHVYTQ